MAMPWDPEGDDAKRFRKILFLALLLSITLGGGTALWKLPPADEFVAVEVPERLVKMVKNEPPPVPPKKEVREKDEKKPDEKKPDEKKPQEKVPQKPVETTTVKTAITTATTAEVKEARAKAESSGMLAFKNNFSEMLDDMPSELGLTPRSPCRPAEPGRRGGHPLAHRCPGNGQRRHRQLRHQSRRQWQRQRQRQKRRRRRRRQRQRPRHHRQRPWRRQGNQRHRQRHGRC
jgi:outer membrane biosynthesis protein TonB